MAINGELHPRGDVHRLYVPRVKGERTRISCESYIRSEKNSLRRYLKNATEKLLDGTRTVRVIETDETVIKREFKKRWTEEGLKKWKDKAMHGQFLRDMPETTHAEQTWSSLIDLMTKRKPSSVQHGDRLYGRIT